MQRILAIVSQYYVRKLGKQHTDSSLSCVANDESGASSIPLLAERRPRELLSFS